MRKKMFSEEQIALAWGEAEAGTPVTEVCRKLKMTEQSFYQRKRKYLGMGVAELRRLNQLEEAYRVSERQACGTLPFHRSKVRYRSKARDQRHIRMRLRDLAASRVRNGYRRLHVLLRREGWKGNHKRIWRLYKEEGLEVRTKKRGKRVSALRVVLPAPAPVPRHHSAVLCFFRFQICSISS